MRRATLLPLSLVFFAIPSFAAPATQPVASSQGPQNPASRPAPEPSATVLVLPFSATAGSQYAWVGKAVQQDLAADLSRATHANIEAPAQATAAPDTAPALAEGRRLGASRVIFGQFQAAGTSMRLTGQVLDVASARAAGGFSATGAATDLFPLEDQVAAQVLRNLPANWLAPGAVAAASNVQPLPQEPIPTNNQPLNLPLTSEATPSAGEAPEYYSYTYPDYTAAPRVYGYNGYSYGYPYYWYSTPYYGPDIFFFNDFDHYHHHHWDNDHDWGDRGLRGGLHDMHPRGFGGGPGGFSHLPSARPMPHSFGGGFGGGFHAGGVHGGGGGMHGGGGAGGGGGGGHNH